MEDQRNNGMRTAFRTAKWARRLASNPVGMKLAFIGAAGVGAVFFLIFVLLGIIAPTMVAGQCGVPATSQLTAGGLGTGDIGPLGGVQGTGVTKKELKLIRSHIYAGPKVTEGKYSATVYGQPWPLLEGTPDTSTGLELGSTNYGKKKYIVAMDPQRNNYGAFVYIWPNPFKWTGPFVVADTGQDGSDGVDIWEWRGMDQMQKWGRKDVKVSKTPLVDAQSTNVSTSSSGSYGYPLSVEAEIGGGPEDHKARAFGNWMSDNAVDLLIPPNTPVTAVGDGVIYKQSGSPPCPSCNPAGWTLYLKSGGQYFSYMHLNKFLVQAGQRVQQGDVIGLSGTANGVDHLHFASTPMNPMDIVRGGGGAPSASTSSGTVDTALLKKKFGIPPDLVPIYFAAAKKYKLGPRGPSILAAINRIETDFGRLANDTSYAGAVGWMQFMPATWDAYGVDGDGDGQKDPTNKFDAIYAAANYLKASGAPGDWYNAIFAYNHADWYVQDVMQHAKQYAPYMTGEIGETVEEGEECDEEASEQIAQATGPGSIELHGGTYATADGQPPEPLKSYLLQMSGMVGEPMKITSGFRSGSITSSGNVSDHALSPGYAADIGTAPYGRGNSTPGVAHEHDKIQEACLILGGMEQAKAAKEALSGPAWDMTHKKLDIQCIWKTGDHYDHVHVGVKEGPPGESMSPFTI